MTEMKESWGWVVNHKWYMRVDEASNFSAHIGYFGTGGHKRPTSREHLGAECLFFPKEYLT